MARRSLALLPLSLLLSLAPGARAGEPRPSKAMQRAEETWSGPPVPLGGPPTSSRALIGYREGTSGCWGEAYDVPGLNAVQIVDEGVVVASGWRGSLPATGGLDEGWPARTLAEKGRTLGRVLGYAAASPGRGPEDHREVAGTLVEAGPQQVAWLSHEQNALYLLWYAGSTPPPALTRCLVSWDGLVARAERALAAHRCADVVAELWPQTWGAPTPGALALLERCDQQWREARPGLDAGDPLEELLAAYEYAKIRTVQHREGTSHAGNYRPFTAAPVGVWLDGQPPLAQVVLAALDRTSLTPAQSMLAPVLRAAIAGEPPRDDLSTSAPPALLDVLPRVVGLDAVGLDASVLQPPHPLFGERDLDIVSSQPSFWAGARGPVVWRVTSLQDHSARTELFDGVGSRTVYVDKAASGDPAYARWVAWTAEQDRLLGAVTAAAAAHGPCGEVYVGTSSERQWTFSSYTVIERSSSVDSTPVWYCPPEVKAAMAALQDFEARTPRPPEPSRIDMSVLREGRSRATRFDVQLGLTIGDERRAWSLSGGLTQVHYEVSEGTDFPYWVTEAMAGLPSRPPADCPTAGTSASLAPFMGYWLADRVLLRICQGEDGAPRTDLALLDSGWSWGLASAPSVQPDGSLYISFAPNSRTPPQGVEVRQEEGGLRLRSKDLTARLAPAGPGVRPPFSEVSTREISSFTRDGRDEVERSAKARLVQALLRESPGLREAFRADLAAVLAAEWGGTQGPDARERARIAYILGLGVGEDAPPSVRLAERWWRSGSRDEEGWQPWPRP